MLADLNMCSETSMMLLMAVMMVNSHYFSYFSAAYLATNLDHFSNCFNTEMGFLEFSLQMEDIVSIDSTEEDLNPDILVSKGR